MPKVTHPSSGAHETETVQDGETTLNEAGASVILGDSCWVVSNWFRERNKFFPHEV